MSEAAKIKLLEIHNVFPCVFAARAFGFAVLRLCVKIILAKTPRRKAARGSKPQGRWFPRIQQAICKTPARVSMAATSSTAGARRWVNIGLPVEFGPATFGKPRATFQCRRGCRHICRSLQPCVRAPPDASNAFPKSGRDEQERSDSDARRHHSTRCAKYRHHSIHTARFPVHV